MRSLRSLMYLCAVPLLLPACRSTGWNAADAAAADSIELQVGARGRWTEIEYHIAPEAVPAPVREAMDRLHPGGPYVGAEKEIEKGELYYELTRKVKGLEIEAMFTPEGDLHSEEIQVAERNVPQAVRTAARAAVPGGRARKWEEIRDGSRALVAYHVKISRRELRYKVMLTPEGEIEGVLREVPAEIEVPVEP